MSSGFVKHSDLNQTVLDMIEKVIKVNKNEDAFYLFDIQDIILKHKRWLNNMPRVKPYYAVKSNPNPIILELLYKLGVGFDCASKGEIDYVLNVGVNAKSIIYANPCKQRSHIVYAAEVGVQYMTFDCDHELYKVKQCHPNARMVLRLKVDDSKAMIKFSDKYGADLNEVGQLLQLAKRIGINVVGCCFHVGSNNMSADTYRLAIAGARHVFDLGINFGFNMYLLDIGGGFPGISTTTVSFEEMAKVINESLEKRFPEVNDSGIDMNYTIIAEPGRYYVASSYTLATNIIAKKSVRTNGHVTDQKYYHLNDGIFSSFLPIPINAGYSEPIPFPTKQPITERQNYNSIVWGQTLAGMDVLNTDIILPELYIGEWILFANMGAYYACLGTQFNGFQMPDIVYYVNEESLNIIKQFPNWTKMSAIFDNNCNQLYSMSDKF